MKTKLNSIRKIEVIAYPDGHGSVTFHRAFGGHTYFISKDRTERGGLIMAVLDANVPNRQTLVADYRPTADILRGELGY